MSFLKNFERKSKENPEKPAICSSNTNISFGDLDIKSNKLVNFIKSLDSEVVGICDAGSVNHFVAMLGCIKAGRPFINLDMNSPVSYNDKILSTLKVHTVIVSPATNPEDFTKYSKLSVEQILESSLSFDAEANFSCDSEATYFVATSGTTGEPKLIMKSLWSLELSSIQIRQALPFLFETSIQMSVPLNYAFGLDQALIFLCAGVTIHINSRQDFFNLQQQYSYIESHQTQTVFWGSPVVKLLSRQPQLFRDMPACLKFIVVGGESLVVSAAFLFELRNRGVTLLNNYGCTETGTLFFSVLKIPLTEIQEHNRIPLGEPLPGFDIILEPEDKGELIVYADNFFNKYSNAPLSASSKFNLEPNAAGKVCFHTGDIAEKINGKYYIVGRQDNCVNVRGYRVEIEAVERYISQILDGEECCVFPHKDDYDETCLVCFYREGLMDSSLLLERLRESLPRYMLPTKFFALAQLPKLSNGKINRKALENFSLEYSNTSPQIDKSLEQRIRQLLQETLRNSVPENFQDTKFEELGLDSLSLVDFICKVEFTEKVMIDDALIVNKTIKTFGDLIEVVRRKR